MSEIAAAVGGSKATLYSYFQSKEELLMAVIENGIKRDVSAIFGMLHTAEPLEVRLRTFAKAFVRFLASPGSISIRKLVIAEAGRSGLPKLLYEFGPRPLRVRAAEMIGDEIKAGRLRKGDPMLTFQVLDALLEGEPVIGLLMGTVDHLSEEELDAAADRAVDVFLRAFAPE